MSEVERMHTMMMLTYFLFSLYMHRLMGPLVVSKYLLVDRELSICNAITNDKTWAQASIPLRELLLVLCHYVYVIKMVRINYLNSCCSFLLTDLSNDTDADLFKGILSFLCFF